MLVPSSRESRRTFSAAGAEEVLWYATRPLPDALEVNGGERLASFQHVGAGERFLLDHDQGSPGSQRLFLRLLMPVCRAPQMSLGAIGFNIVSLKHGCPSFVSDDRRVFEAPTRADPKTEEQFNLQGWYARFVTLPAGAHFQFEEADGKRSLRSDCLVKLAHGIVPAPQDCPEDERLNALAPATGELVTILPDTLVIRFGRGCSAGTDGHGD